MDNRNWKKKNKPSACTRAPWEYLIPPEDRKAVMRQIRFECIDIYGHSFDECPKRMVCLKKSCIGRPLPWKAPTAKPYLKELKKTQKIEKEELFIQTDCSVCPIVDKCKQPCYQIEDFIQRDKVQEPKIYYKAKNSALDAISNKGEKERVIKNYFKSFNKAEDIPWECLSDLRRKTIKKYLYDQLDFKYIANQLGLANEATCKYEFYAALTKLSKYAMVIKFLKENMQELTDKQKKVFTKVFLENKTQKIAAEELNVKEDAVSHIINRVIKKYNIEWYSFVKKEKGYVATYNVPEMFK